MHRAPTRPVVDQAGTIANPLAPWPAVELDDTRPLDARDLEPDRRYESPGFEYYTDDQALPARVRGRLRIVPPAERVRHRSVQASAGRLASLGDGLHGGHIVAVSLGGFASGPNLFPQQRNFNVSAYARLEHGWRHALLDGVSVDVDIALTLGTDDPAAPEFVIATYWEDGEEFEHVLLNEPHAQ